MLQNPTVIIESCQTETARNDVKAKVISMLEKLPGLDTRLSSARCILIKPNIGNDFLARMYKGWPTTFVDPVMLEAVADYLRPRTKAKVLVGDGVVGGTTEGTARNHGYMDVIEREGFSFIDFNAGPYERFDVSDPVMFRWYSLPAVLKDIDLTISLAKLKSHETTGVTLTIKNLFGIPPCPVYGSPRVALHSPMRLPRFLPELTSLFPPEIALIDGIIGCNYAAWHGDPVTTGVLIVGNNAVATDSVGARFMGVDPEASHGIAPFIYSENHIKMASTLGLGPVMASDINLIGEMPSGRRPFSVVGAAESETFSQQQAQVRETCRMARWYFDERQSFVEQYQDEMIVLAKDRVIMHMPVNKMSITELAKRLSDEGLDIMAPFYKLVEAEEAELRAPYDECTFAEG